MVIEALPEDTDDAPSEEPHARAPAIGVVLLGVQGLQRASLKSLLDQRAGFRVVAESDNCATALRQAGDRRADLFVVDFDADVAAAIASIAEIHAADAEARVIVLLANRDSEVTRRAVLAGASGIVFKDRSPEHLLDAMAKVHEGELWVDRATAAQVISDLAARRRKQAADPVEDKIRSLTLRERELVALILEGLSNKRMATRLGISEHTVRHHLTSIFAKLGLSDRLGLVAFAFRHGLGRPAR
jgi:two-component system nitrate/nitrite response regulator NarL